MKEMNSKQFLLELLKLSGMNQEQIAEAIGVSQGTISNMIKTGNPNMKRIMQIFMQGLELVPSFFFDGKMYIYAGFRNTGKELLFISGKTVEEVAEAMKMKPSTLRSRICRNSCNIEQFKFFLQALDNDLIFIINNKKYRITNE